MKGTIELQEPITVTVEDERQVLEMTIILKVFVEFDKEQEEVIIESEWRT